VKSKLLIVGGAALVVLAIALIVNTSNRSSTKHQHLAEEPAAASNHSHGRLPAFQPASEVKTLAPTLSPGEFFGKAREAYAAAKVIPETLAQLPCYCHCDRGFGHKSLHTCFVDDHASHCAVCVDEALLAYKLQKEDKMSPEQIRELIIAKYSAAD
jgi:hypothetical protein